MVHVVVSNVSKTFGGKHGHRVLSGINLSVRDGEFLVLLGPSGSGKTTLLRAIAGLETIDLGKIMIGDVDVTELDPARRNVGMVFQDYALYPHMTVRQNISYNMKIRGIGWQEADRRVEEVAATLGIRDYLNRRPSQLSGGQRQRVALARAVTREGQVLLMDEPLSNLDAQIREHVRVELKELQHRIGVTTIYVTHDQVEAMIMADRIAIMSEGRIEQLGKPAEIYDAPETLFCARFVGSPKSNEIQGSCRLLAGGRALFLVRVEQGQKRQELAINVERQERLEADLSDALLVFRPEDATVMGAEDGGVQATVTFVENRGAEKYIVVDLAKRVGLTQTSADLRLKVADSELRPAGTTISFLPSRVHVFARQSGRLLMSGECTGGVLGGGSSKSKRGRKGERKN